MQIEIQSWVYCDGEIAGKSVNRILPTDLSFWREKIGRKKQVLKTHLSQVWKNGKRGKMDEKHRGESRKDEQNRCLQLENTRSSWAMTLTASACSTFPPPSCRGHLPPAFGECGRDALAMSNYRTILCLWVRRITSSYVYKGKWQYGYLECENNKLIYKSKL